MLGLLGPNGARKSTLMQILATITQPTRISVTWNGFDIADHADALCVEQGYTQQDCGVYPNLNDTEFLTYYAAVKGLKRSNSRQDSWRHGPAERICVGVPANNSLQMTR